MVPEADPIRRRRPGQLLDAEMDAIVALKLRVFGEPDSAEEAKLLAEKNDADRAWWVRGEGVNRKRFEPDVARFHLLHHDGQLAAIAQSSVRTLHTEAGSFPVLTLAGVASDPSVRGAGLGKAIVLDAFARLDEERLTHCLFQTGQARGFYEKLGGTLVTNRFVDRTAQPPNEPEANPWADDWVMRYPATASWPGGTIDLNGPGY